MKLFLREQLAALEHDSWSRWMKFSKCTLLPNGSMIIPASLVQMWKRKMNTLYKDLTEKEKESDRAEVDIVLNTLRGQEDELIK